MCQKLFIVDLIECEIKMQFASFWRFFLLTFCSFLRFRIPQESANNLSITFYGHPTNILGGHGKQNAPKYEFKPNRNQLFLDLNQQKKIK